ncbi:MAG TPA: M67 family metallopeptidase [Rhizomicrobium sp.]
MIATLILPRPLRDQIAREALAAHPSECCGLIEGTYIGDVAEAARCHPTRNLAEGADRFEIDPAQHITLLRTLRDGPNNIVGCYHSHPNGRPEPSPRDLESAVEEDFVWLIAAGDELAAFIHRRGTFHPIHIA